jgi:hypothetical protein
VRLRHVPSFEGKLDGLKVVVKHMSDPGWALRDAGSGELSGLEDSGHPVVSVMRALSHPDHTSRSSAIGDHSKKIRPSFDPISMYVVGK